MKVLYLVPNTKHSHDYGVDFLYHGLCNVLGQENVYDWPERDTLHRDPRVRFDECNYDSDQCWPKRGYGLWDIVPLLDLVIISIQPHAAYTRGCGYEVPEQVAGVCLSLPRYLPIVAVDSSDEMTHTAGFYTQVAGRTLAAYFKRELPKDAHWGLPLPLCYPADRAPDPLPEKLNRVFYCAESHGTSAPSVSRGMIANSLMELPVDNRLVRLHHGLKCRTHPDQYHAEMARSLVGVSWNGVANWDGNRTWEQFAYGLCQVIERPRIRIPNCPREGEHCFYADRPEHVGRMVADLLRMPDVAKQVGRQGHEWFKLHHSSEARARYFLEMVERVG